MVASPSDSTSSALESCTPWIGSWLPETGANMIEALGTIASPYRSG